MNVDQHDPEDPKDPRARGAQPARSRLSPAAEALRTAGSVGTVGFSFVLAIVIGFVAGRVVDGWLGTSPWLERIGLLFGLAAGVLTAYRVVRSAMRP